MRCTHFTSNYVFTLVFSGIFLTGCSNSSAPAVSFKQQVFPILAEKCLPCHAQDGRGYRKTGLLLDSYDNLVKGSHEGQAITPGDTGKSPLSIFIHPIADASTQMPLGKNKKMTKTEIDLIDTWINQGAKNN